MNDSDQQNRAQVSGEEAQPEELPEGEVELKRTGETTVKPRQEAEPAPPDKKIHPRRPVPLVPEKPQQD